MATSGKQTALKIIGQLPETASLEDIIYELYVRKRIERGLSELSRKRTVSHTSVKRSMAAWLKSAGR
ncbi:MAG: hypothetical protein U0172_01530 [Nitrospiraceae bacterium]